MQCVYEVIMESFIMECVYEIIMESINYGVCMRLL